MRLFAVNKYLKVDYSGLFVEVRATAPQAAIRKIQIINKK